ncbi:MAG: signal peptidase II [Gammaproteobacteria bacterium]
MHERPVEGAGQPPDRATDGAGDSALRDSGLRWLWLSVLVLGLDQLTKLLANSLLAWDQPLHLLPSLNFTLVYNTGAAFSFLSTASGWQRWFFIALGLVAVVVMVVWLSRLSVRDRLGGMAVALILGGALGNVVDRVWHGRVIDFIDVYYRHWHWPAFNVADSAITVGVALLIVDGVLGARRTQEGE